MKRAVGNASGKIILMGEHAVVYDAYAIALPFVATKTEVEIRIGDDRFNSFLYHGKFEQAPSHLRGFILLLDELRTRYNDNEKYHVNINSTIPQQRGMGSSAAVANALIDAYVKYHEITLTFEEKFELSMIAETINHGKPSGIDSLTTMSQTPIYFKKGPNYETININLSGYLIVADSQIKGQTIEAVTHIASIMHVQSTKDAIEELNTLSKLSKQAIENDQLQVLGDYMNRAHVILDELGVSHPTVNTMVKLATSAGAYGAKMTGGGKGGVMIAIAPSDYHTQNIIRVLKSHGFNNTWVLNLKEAFQ